MLKNLIFKILSLFVEVVPKIDNDQIITAEELKASANNFAAKSIDSFLETLFWARFCNRYPKRAQEIYVSILEKNVDNPEHFTKEFAQRAGELIRKNYPTKFQKLKENLLSIAK